MKLGFQSPAEFHAPLFGCCFHLRSDSENPRREVRRKLCGDFNVSDPHKLRGSGTIRRRGLVGVGVVLLEEVCHCGGRL